MGSNDSSGLFGQTYGDTVGGCYSPHLKFETMLDYCMYYSVVAKGTQKKRIEWKDFEYSTSMVLSQQ